MYRTFTALISLALLLLVGCDSTEADMDDMADTEDVAASVALALGEDPGGMSDQLNDVLLLTEAALGKTAQFDDLNLTYDPDRGVWSGVVDRSRTITGGRSAEIYRVYEFQFLNEGQPRRAYMVNGDAADTIIFEILEGTGSYTGPAYTHALTDVAGAWTVTDADTDVVTVDGTYGRAGTDQLTGPQATRALDHELFAEMTLTVQRGGTAADASGTVSGTYEGTYTLEQDGATEVTDIDVTFTASFANGEITIEVNGEEFTSSVRSGQMR